METPLRDMAKKRNPVIDRMRGIGIIMVILGHDWIAPVFVRKFVYEFHMPLFFIVSGYLFHSIGYSSIGEFIWLKLRRLYIPALVIGLSCAIPSFLTGQTNNWQQFSTRLLGVVYSIPKSDMTFNCTPIWFLSCLFCVEVIYFLLNRLLTLLALTLTIALLYFLGQIFFNEPKCFSPLNVVTAFSCVIFFHFGRALRFTDFFENHRPRSFFAILAFALLVAVCFFNPVFVDVSSGRYGPPGLLIITGMAGSYMVFWFASVIRSEILLAYFGRNTVIILGYNYWGYYFCNKLCAGSWCVNLCLQLIFFMVLCRGLDHIPRIKRLLQGVR